MTIDEAIIHAEEEAEQQVKLCKRYDDASGYSRSNNESIRTADAKRCEACAEEHRQLAKWLKDYKRLLEQESTLEKLRAEIKSLSPKPTAYDVVDGNPVKDAIWETLIEVEKIIDKHIGKER